MNGEREIELVTLLLELLAEGASETRGRVTFSVHSAVLVTVSAEALERAALVLKSTNLAGLAQAS